MNTTIKSVVTAKSPIAALMALAAVSAPLAIRDAHASVECRIIQATEEWQGTGIFVDGSEFV